MDDWFNALSSRANALKTDDELRAECKCLSGPGPEARKHKARLEVFLNDRRSLRQQKSAAHREAPFDAQKDKFRERDQ